MSMPVQADSVAVVEGRLLAWVPGRLTNPLNGPHGHWPRRAKERKGWRERTFLCCTDAMRRAGITPGRQDSSVWHPQARKVVVLTAYVWNLYDDDGLAAALKGVVDGLRDAHLLHDDGPKSGHRVERRQVINRQHRGVEIVVEPRRESDHE